MKKILLITLLASAGMWMSCGGDEESEPTAEELIVNSWVLDSYFYENLPTDFSYWEGYENTTLFGESKYLLNFEEDSYTRTFDFTTDSFTEDGEWSIVDTELVLDPTGTGLQISNIFELITNDGEDLVIRAEQREFLTTNAFQDTLAQYVQYLDANSPENINSFNDYLSTLTDNQYDSVLNAILKPVVLDVTYDFDLNPN